MTVELIIQSGGQSGVDRGGLNAALACGLEYRGWVPKGGRCEDSPYLLDAFPLLKQTESAEYPERTRLNVKEADATLIVTPSGRLESPGSRLTAKYCQELHKTWTVCAVNQVRDNIIRLVQAWNGYYPKIVLNVAGTRESKAPGIKYQVRNQIVEAVNNLRRIGLLAPPREDLQR